MTNSLPPQSPWDLTLERLATEHLLADRYRIDAEFYGWNMLRGLHALCHCDRLQADAVDRLEAMLVDDARFAFHYARLTLDAQQPF